MKTKALTFSTKQAALEYAARLQWDITVSVQGPWERKYRMIDGGELVYWELVLRDWGSN